MDELENIKMRYAWRAENLAPPTKGDMCFARAHIKERESKFLKILHRHFGNDFSMLKMIEIGAGGGQNLHFFIRSGFAMNNIWANELLDDRFDLLKQNFPEITADHGDASRLDHHNIFDLVLQSTVFTSILNDPLKQKLADTMYAMVKPGGMILWYDFTFDNPRNKHVKGVGKSEIRQLFQKASDIRFTRVTLAPPIGRKVFGMYNLINFAFPFLRTHIIAEIYK